VLLNFLKAHFNDKRSDYSIFNHYWKTGKTTVISPQAYLRTRKKKWFNRKKEM